MCSAYFTDLVKELADQILSGGFQIPLLVNMDTKSKNSATLEEVR